MRPLKKQDVSADTRPRTPRQFLGGIECSPGDKIPAEWMKPASPKWQVAPAQMFKDCEWDRAAGRWRFIDPVDDPQGRRFAIALGEKAAEVAKGLNAFPVVIVDGFDEMSTVVIPDWAEHVLIITGSDPAAIAVGEAIAKQLSRPRISVKTMVVGG